MRHFGRVLVRGMMGLTAALVMAGLSQASAALYPGGQRSAVIMAPTKINSDCTRRVTVEKAEGIRSIVLAQKNEPESEKPKSPPGSETKVKKMKRAAPPAPSMEKQSERGEDLERAGTRKLGGEIIRNKEE
jgi:hypothetical protein